jgi:predicted GNAT family N-acyltransferase
MQQPHMQIRRWHSEELCLSLRKVVHQQIVETDRLKAAISLAQEDPQNTVIVTLGFEKDEVLGSLETGGGEERLEVVSVVPGREGSLLRPSASLLERPVFFTTSRKPTSYIRKSVLRLSVRKCVHLREIESDDDLSQYFSLRYRVWKEMGYLLEENDCPVSRWEISYSDHTAFPIGMFSSEEKLLACARLVRVYGHENRILLPKISALIDGKNDCCLRRNFDTPPFPHPFDLLEAFSGFGRYYRECVRHNIDKAEVSRVIVKPGFRRKFYGEVIVDSLVTLARKRNIAALFLACVERHEHIYRRCGFRKIPGLNCESFPGVGVKAIAMERHLSQV